MRRILNLILINISFFLFIQPAVSAAEVYSDDFSVDSRSSYTVVNTWTDGGVGKLLFDAIGKRLQVKTGDNIGLSFSRGLLAPSSSGLLSLDFLPMVKYPSGGRIYLRLEQDAANYYLIYNTDGYGPGVVQKVVAGQVVEQASFVVGYQQGTNYHLAAAFAPNMMSVNAFGGSLVLSKNSVPLMVNRFVVEISQQDAYIDNISYSSVVSNLPPTADAGADRTVNAADVVVLDGSGSRDPDGTIVSYLWEQTTGPAVTLSGSGIQRSFTAPSVGTAAALTFRLTVIDNQGVIGTDTVVVTVSPQGGSVFSDDFSVDSRSQYTVVNTWTDGGVGKILYDAIGKRLQVKTGDNVGLSFSRSFSAPSATGSFSLDFLPTVKYPSGGRFYLRLEQDAANYYLVYNSDGYGPGGVSKWMNGVKVAEALFQSGYVQNTSYRVNVSFSPTGVTVQAFGQGGGALSTGSASILVNRFVVEISQQDAYIDNISYSSVVANLPPTADAGLDRTVNAADVVVLDGSGSGDPDGTIVSYLWEQITGPAVTLSGSGAQRSFTAPAVSTATALTFQLTVTDNQGAIGTDTVVVTVPPQGTSSYSDDFSVDSRSQYTVTNTWTVGGVGQFLYDATVGRLQVLTGDNIGLSFSRGFSVPSATGLFSLDFLPTVKYPSGGRFMLRLEQDAANYYLINNTDGYGPGGVSKWVNGTKVAEALFESGYVQNTAYKVDVSFSPTGVEVQPFGQNAGVPGDTSAVVSLSTGSTPILVKSFTLELQQQDAYIDNVGYAIDPSVSLVALGDSITRGSRDDILTDGVGYPPVLARLLTAMNGYPQIIFNEGVSGHTSLDGLSRLPSLLGKYAYPRVFLLQFGTNDAVATPPIPSGLGLHSGDAGYPGSFKDNMQQMINQLASVGKTAYLAKAPYSFDALSAQRNFYVQQYNNVVDELILENNIAIVPPDFYKSVLKYPAALLLG